MKRTLTTLAPAVLTGTLLFLAFPTTDLHFLAWIGLVPLLLQTRSLPARETAAHFFLAGWVFHSLVLQWLSTNIYWAGGWATLGYQLLCIYLALFWLVAGALWRWTMMRLPRIGAGLSLAILWCAMEYTQSFLFTGFGWSALAYSQATNPFFLQWASIGGYLSLGGILVFTNGMLADALANSQARLISGGIAVATLIVVHAVGFFLYPSQSDDQYDADPLRVGLVQPSTPLEMKWDEQYKQPLIEDAALKSRILADIDEVDLFVWPEALVTRDVRLPEVADTLKSLVKDTDADLFTGAQRIDNQLYYNSSYLLQPGGDFSAYYDKIRLAPYGEYVPLSDILPFISNFLPSMADQTPGESQRLFESKGRKFGPLICFEVLFSPMSQQLRDDGADMLVVVTNLGWFGQSNALTQELAIAKIRAVETRLPIVHAANTGISGVIDPYGRVRHLTRYIDHSGAIYNLNAEIDAYGTRGLRLAGSIPVPKPASNVFSPGPRYFPWIAAGLCIIMLIATTLARPAPPEGAPKPKKD